MGTRDELQVIRDVLGGDVAAFRLIVERYERPLFSFIRTYVGDTHECEDIAQEVLLAAYSRLDSYAPSRASFTTWLFTIARNRCLNWIKQKRPVAERTELECVDSRTPVADATEQEFFGQLDLALAELPIDQRTAFVLCEIEGLPYEQIAQIENTRLGTVKSRISRAKKMLRSILPEMKGKQ